MSQPADIIKKAAETPEALTPDDFAELRRACRDWPASALAPAILLKYAGPTLTDGERADFRARVALYGGSDGMLVKYVDPSGLDFATFYPPAPRIMKPSTESTIDTFLETYGHQSAEEDALLERMIFNPVPDYAEQLARDTAAPAKAAGDDWQDNLIDAFLASQGCRNDSPLPGDEPAAAAATQAPAPAPAPHPAKPKTAAPPPAPDTLLSESLAKIFIKQGRYERAYEIITNLSLNYPKKSVYFADQLRFLQKLIINQRLAKRDTEQ